jgi:hypothetical protein
MGPRSQLRPWVCTGASRGGCVPGMTQAVRALLSASALLALLPATAGAATVTATGDDGNPVALNTLAPTALRNMDVNAEVVVAESEAAYYKTVVVDGAGTPASTESPCRQTRFGPSWTNYADYRGNGTYTVILRYYGASTCATATREQRFQYTINAGTAVTGPPGKLLTRPANSFATNTHTLPVALNPGALTYEVRYALGGVVGPDGAISGPSAETYVDRTTGTAPFRFDKPGRYLIVARVKGGDYYTPWSAPVTVTAVAPFDIQSVAFPDARGPSYKLRGQVRELAARGRVIVSAARGRKGGKYRRLGRARINSNGRFTLRFRLRRTGIYRLRYTYKGSDLVNPGRVTEMVRVRRRVFFG